MSIIELKVPTIGESITEVTLSQWLKKDGDIIKRDEAICEFESDKATLEFPAEADGKLTIIAKEGEDLPIGAIIAKLDTSFTADNSGSTDTVPQVKEASKEAPKEIKDDSSYAKGHPSPAATKILEEKGVAVESITGSGKGGRITKEDALKVATPIVKNDSGLDKTHSVIGPKLPDLSSEMNSSRSERSVKMSRMRKTIAARLI